MSSGHPRPALPFLVAILAASGLASACSAHSSSGSSGVSRSGPGAVAAGGVRVTPSRGYPSTTFRVSFTAPARTGRVGGTRSTDVVTATGPHGPKGCVDGADIGLGASRAGQRLTATLAPAAHRSRWCPGAYTGRVDMTTRPVCQPGRMCPQFVAVRRIGSFRFVVRAVR